MRKKFLVVGVVLLAVLILGVAVLANPKKRVCPDMWFDNQMPGVTSDKTPRQYFIVNGERRELTEYDIDWVKANCKLKVEVVS